MVKSKETKLTEEAEKIKAELEELKKEKKKMERKEKSKKTTEAKKEPKAKKTTAKKEPQAKKTTAKKEPKAKKLTKEERKKQQEEEKAKKEAEERTLEEELEEQYSDAEIENFQIEKVDMEKLTNKVCEILIKFESDGMLQSDLWKKLKLSSRDGSRLALRMERRGIITRQKILEKGRWTYKLILKKTPISTISIENAPCLICPVEQKCSVDGEISPRNCQWIEEWVQAELKKPKKQQ